MDLTAPSCDEIEELARETVAKLPHAFRARAQAVAIRVTEFADDDTLDEMEMEPFELTGLYDGVPLTEKSTFDQPNGPDTVWLFRRPILDEWAERGNVTIARAGGACDDPRIRAPFRLVRRRHRRHRRLVELTLSARARSSGQTSTTPWATAQGVPATILIAASRSSASISAKPATRRPEVRYAPLVTTVPVPSGFRTCTGSPAIPTLAPAPTSAASCACAASRMCCGVRS